jgi:hypothetical protein
VVIAGDSNALDDPRSIIVLRYESRAGHGGVNPVAKVLDEAADGYAFLGRVFGIDFSKPNPPQMNTDGHR